MLIRPAAGVVAAYLVTTLPLVVLGADGRAGSVAIVAAHCLGIATAVLGSRRDGRGILRVVLDAFPLAFVPFMYAELPQLMSGAGAAYQDALIQRWELLLFDDSPARTLASLLPWAWLSEPLHAAYFSYYALIFLPPITLYALGRREQYREMCFGLLVAFTACFAVFAVFPVQGPRYLWDPAAPEGPVRRLVLGVLEAGSSRGAAFPSSHVAVAVVQSVLSIRYGVPFAWWIPGLTLGLGVGAVYGGFHYAVDAVAGAAVGAVVAVGAPALHRRVSHRAASPPQHGQGEPLGAS